MTATQVLITVIVLIVIAALGYGIWFVTRRRALQNRFGPEYDRAVAEGDSRLAAERELRERERRHAELQIKDLSPESRARYTGKWEEIQARFLDDPAGAVRDADALVTELVTERGYPTGDYEEHLSHLSVEHARTVGHYRDAHEISQLSDRGEATTEQLRQAVVHYRTLFSELLGTDVTPTGRANTAPADAVVAEPADVAEPAVVAEPAAVAAPVGTVTEPVDTVAADRADARRAERVDETDHAEAAAAAAEHDAEHVTGFDDPAARHDAELHQADDDAVDGVPAQRTGGDAPHNTRSRS
ncbi:hypothetical protein [Dactylosporangium sp. CS-033363]|uniref:hypothetical protein n=1 Tax=Dactylosporangium sp. CS-033363 TaxID=3239935 RepID=UPI003D89FB5C